MVVVPGLKKARLMHLPDLFEGRGEMEQCNLVCVCVCVCVCVYGVPLHDWANDGYVDFLCACGERGFSSLESWI